MKKVHKDRLLKLADFLEKLPRKKFDYDVVTRGEDIPRKELDCGTVGCAIGWCPVVFPIQLKYRRRERFELGPMIYNKEGLNFGFRESKPTPPVREFFGVSLEESQALFNPYRQEARYALGMRAVNEKSTPKAVAKNIRLFVKHKENELQPKRK